MKFSAIWRYTHINGGDSCLADWKKTLSGRVNWTDLSRFELDYPTPFIDLASQPP
jgi:hypothetical protein